MKCCLRERKINIDHHNCVLSVLIWWRLHWGLLLLVELQLSLIWHNNSSDCCPTYKKTFSDSQNTNTVMLCNRFKTFHAHGVQILLPMWLQDWAHLRTSGYAQHFTVLWLSCVSSSKCAFLDQFLVSCSTWKMGHANSNNVESQSHLGLFMSKSTFPCHVLCARCKSHITWTEWWGGWEICQAADQSGGSTCHYLFLVDCKSGNFPCALSNGRCKGFA